MAQLRILGPVIYGVVGVRAGEVERIDPTRARAALEQLGHSRAVADLLSHHALDSAAARRLGSTLGLLTKESV